MEQYNVSVARMLGRVTVPPNTSGRGGASPYTFMTPGLSPTGGELSANAAREPGIFGGIQVDGFELQGRLSAGFVGVIVIALVGFYFVTRGFQL